MDLTNISIDDLNRGYPFDFNSMYEGYYVKCKFTAFDSVFGTFWLAGIDSEENPHLFSSYSGEVWEEISLIMRTPYGMVQHLKSPVIKILGDEKDRQLYLICKDGEIVILPDCPKCMRIKNISLSKQIQVISAEFTDESSMERQQTIKLYLSDGTEKDIDCGKLRQYRIAVTFAKKLILQGATVIDVRELYEDYGKNELEFEHVLKIPIGNLSEYLEKTSKKSTVIFLCETGRKADYAAEYARKQGFYRAYSIGGVEEWAHLE